MGTRVLISVGGGRNERIYTVAISKFHGQKNVPMSRVLTFTEGCDRVDVKCYLHSDHFAPQGWYEPAQRTVPLKMPFSF